MSTVFKVLKVFFLALLAVVLLGAACFGFMAVKYRIEAQNPKLLITKVGLDRDDIKILSHTKEHARKGLSGDYLYHSYKIRFINGASIYDSVKDSWGIAVDAGRPCRVWSDNDLWLWGRQLVGIHENGDGFIRAGYPVDAEHLRSWIDVKIIHRNGFLLPDSHLPKRSSF